MAVFSIAMTLPAKPHTLPALPAPKKKTACTAGPAEAGEAEGRMIWLAPSQVAPPLEFGPPLEQLLNMAHPRSGPPHPAGGGASSNGREPLNSSGGDSPGNRPAASSARASGRSSNGSTCPGASSGARPGGNDGNDAGPSSSPSVEGEAEAAVATELVEVYRDAGYVLAWQGGRGVAVLREGAPITAALQVCPQQPPEMRLQ